jgi:hypothetical protein
MQQVLGQHLAQVARTDDQQPIEQFPAQVGDHRVAYGVRSGGLRRAGENLDRFCLEDGIEGTGQLACTIPDQGI